MITRIQHLLKDKFIRGTIFLTVVNFLSSFINYLVHPLLARNLSISQYGDFQALLSFLTLGGVVAGVVTIAVTKEVSILNAEQNQGAIKFFQKQLNFKLLGVGSLLFLLLILFSVSITNFFHITNVFAIVVTSIFFVYTLPLAVNRGILAGLQKFPSLSINSLLDPLSKLSMVVLLVVILHWKLLGASVAIALSGFLPLMISFIQIRRIHLPQGEFVNYKFSAIFKYSFVVLFFTLSMQLFYNLDMIFVKSVFSSEQAGLYGALLTVGRIIFFVGGVVPLVMFPVIAGFTKAEGLRKYKTLLKSLVLMSGMIFPIVLIMVVWPELVLKILVGGKYILMAQYLPLFTIPMILLTSVTILAQYFLALSDKKPLLILIAGLAIELLVLANYHNSIINIIWSLIFSFGLLLSALIFYLIANYQIDKKYSKI